MKSIYKFLYFNKNERIALFVFLLVLIFISVVYQLVKPQVLTTHYEFSKQTMTWVDTGKSKLVSSSIKKAPTQTQHIPISSNTFIPLKININLADSTEFRELKGIGDVFSSRIVRYRNWLGGFYTEKQLLEVYGIDSVLFESIAPYLSISINSVRKININSCNKKNLSTHPYISYKIAESIIKYREHHGPYKSINDLKLIPLIDEKLFRKIAYYLELE